MKRPLAVSGFSLFCALLLSFVLDTVTASILSVLFAVSALLFFLFRKQQLRWKTIFSVAALILITVAAGVLYGTIVREVRVSSLDVLADQEAEITGTVTDKPDSSGTYTFLTLKVESSDTDIPKGTRIRLEGTGLEGIDAFDRITLKAVLSPLSDAYTGSVYRSRLASGIRLTGTVTGNVHYEGCRDQGIDVLLYKWRTRLTSGIIGNLDEISGGLTAALVTGDRSYLDEDLSEEFRITGTRHLLSLSGFHLSLITAIALGFFTLIRVPATLRILLTMLTTGLYIGLSGCPFSIQRAGIMTGVMLLGLLLHKSPDAINSLGLSLLIICLINPFAAGDAGLQLSAGSVLGILLCAERMSKALVNKMPLPEDGVEHYLALFFRKCVKALCVSFSAVIGALPFLIITYGTVSVVGPIVTLLIGWILPFLMIPGFLLAVFSRISWLDWLVPLLKGVVNLAADLMRSVVHLFARLPFAEIRLDRGFVIAWLILLTIGLILLHFFRQSRKIKAVFLSLSGILLMGCSLFDGAISRGVLNLSTVLTVEGCNGILLTESDSSLYIGSCDSSSDTYRLSQMLSGREPDAAVLFSPQEEAALLEKWPDTETVLCGNGYAGIAELEDGRLFLLNDRSGHSAVYFEGPVTLLWLSDNFELQDLESDFLHPDWLVLSGEVGHLELAGPQYAVLTESSCYNERVTLLAKGCEVFFPSGESEFLLTLSARNPSLTKFDSEIL